jgi:ribosomal protein L37E
MMIKCQRCGRVWDYTGANYRGTCAKCGTSVAVERARRRYLESIAETETVATGEAACVTGTTPKCPLRGWQPCAEEGCALYDKKHAMCAFTSMAFAARKMRDKITVNGE